MKRNKTVYLVAALAACCCACAVAGAQDYPTKPITMIVPFPAGGGVDAVARIVAEKLSGALGQQVDRRQPRRRRRRARHALGAKAAPDGYTLVMAHTGTTSINPTLYANPGYDPRKDFSADRTDQFDADRADGASLVPGEDRSPT